MLDKAVAAVKADRDVALAMFNKGESGFRDRDLYPFCIRAADGKNVAGPVYVRAGMDTTTLKDPTGKAYGQEIFAVAQKPEGHITEVSYMASKPGTTSPAVAKVTFATRVNDLVIRDQKSGTARAACPVSPLSREHFFRLRDKLVSVLARWELTEFFQMLLPHLRGVEGPGESGQPHRFSLLSAEHSPGSISHCSIQYGPTPAPRPEMSVLER
jgi:hypothetical protein